MADETPPLIGDDHVLLLGHAAQFAAGFLRGRATKLEAEDAHDVRELAELLERAAHGVAYAMQPYPEE